VNTVTKDALPLAPAPELVIGLVGPIGVDLDSVTTLLEDALHGVDYKVDALRVTQLMREIPTDVEITDPNHAYIDSFRRRISYANKVRDLLQRSDAMAILAVSAIRQLRKERGGDEETPIPSQAYIIRQLRGQKRSNCFVASTDGNSSKFPHMRRRSTASTALP
jgi:hypothetical protein